MKMLNEKQQKFARKDEVILSQDMIETFLSTVHPFTAVGLEAHGYVYSTDYSRLPDHLVFFPQVNEKERVLDADDAYPRQKLEGIVTSEGVKDLVYRGRIHTHHEALLTEQDMYTLISQFQKMGSTQAL